MLNLSSVSICKLLTSHTFLLSFAGLRSRGPHPKCFHPPTPPLHIHSLLQPPILHALLIHACANSYMKSVHVEPCEVFLQDTHYGWGYAHWGSKLPIMTGRFHPPQSTQINCHLNLNRQRNLVFEDPFLPLGLEEAELAEQYLPVSTWLEGSELPALPRLAKMGTAGTFSFMIFLRGLD